ncbi:MAG TPA: tetratricopeptide repeat protein, partial [Steroidobacteraceae bacterium]|nr:tetratricopeptide repeat protein [Steroidobacteraceae bacterium]
GYVLGMYAFGLEETAAYGRAEETGRRALELNPRDPWAVHAVAHVMEMQGRHRDGIDWLTQTARNWSAECLFAYHNWWHLALFHLDLGEVDRALELYDTAIHPQPTQVPLELVDAVALLWRLRLRGIEVGDRWHDVAESWAKSPEDGFYAFNDAHALLSFVAAGRREDVARVVTTLERRAADSDTNGRMTREVGLPLVRGVTALADGDGRAALEHLLPMRTRAHRFGGSHAQRDLVHLTLVEAAFAAQDFGRARALVAERTEQKPTSPFNWQLAARAHSGLGAGEQADRCLERAERARSSAADRVAA